MVVESLAYLCKVSLFLLIIRKLYLKKAHSPPPSPRRPSPAAAGWSSSPGSRTWWCPTGASPLPSSAICRRHRGRGRRWPGGRDGLSRGRWTGRVRRWRAREIPKRLGSVSSSVSGAGPSVKHYFRITFPCKNFNILIINDLYFCALITWRFFL